MRTIANAVEERVLSTPFFELGLTQGLLNVSALARRWRPGIEEELCKPVSEAAVAMALRRLAAALPADRAPTPGRQIEDLTVRSSLIQLTYPASPAVLEALPEFVHLAAREVAGFSTFTRGVAEVTLILDARLEARALEILGRDTITRIDDLAAMSLRLAPDTVGVPGVYYSLLKQLALRGINVVEVVSTFTELAIILSRSHLDRAFSVLLEQS